MLIQTTILAKISDYTSPGIINTYLPDSVPKHKNIIPVWFDIETTGLSPETSYLYMIGAAKIINGEYVLTQWISEKYTDEPELLGSFLEYINNCDVLIHFNGATFDIPYLAAKCSDYGLSDTIIHKNSLDIYREIKPYKALFGMTALNQRYVERFCGLNREDRFSGSELIPLYNMFAARLRYEQLHGSADIPYSIKPSSATGLPSITDVPSNQILSILLQHNRDDVAGMLYLMRLLHIRHFLQGDFMLEQVNIKNDCLNVIISYTSPDNDILDRIKLLYSNEYVRLSSKSSGSIEIEIKITDTELKYFYDNYHDYYYLVIEDTAIHKSVAGFVDKQYRKPAKASNCYIRRKGLYLPAYGFDELPLLRKNYKDKCYYFEMTESFLSDKEQITCYITALLNNIIKRT